MNEEMMNDERFLAYCEIHCRTERALFHRDDVARLLRLALPGQTVGNIPLEWVAMRQDFADPLIAKARERLKVEAPSKEKKTVEKDPINPQHYRNHPSGVEAIDICEHLSFCLGNALKYVWRAGMKGDREEDLKKALWYCQREERRLKLVSESTLIPVGSSLNIRKTLDKEPPTTVLFRFLAVLNEFNGYVTAQQVHELTRVVQAALGIEVPPTPSDPEEEEEEEEAFRPKHFSRRGRLLREAKRLIQSGLDTIAVNASPEWRERAEAFLEELKD